MIGELRLFPEVPGPELAVPPRVPARGAQQLPLRGVEVVIVAEGRPGGRGHGGEGRAERPRQVHARLDGLDQQQLGAVEMDDERNVRPIPADRVELGREVVEVEHVGAVGAGFAERLRPRFRQVWRA